MKKIVKTTLILGLLFVVVAILPFQIPWSSSSETFIAEKLGVELSDAPRTPSGLLDISAISNRELSDGVTAQNNIVVDYVQLFGTDDVPNELLDQMLEYLQIADSAGPNEWVPWDEQNANSASAGEDFDSALSRPWVAAENQAANDWIEANQGALDQLVTASFKTRYYHPLVSNDGDLISSLLPYAQHARTAARALSMRGLNNVAKGDLDAALRDAAAIRRLGFRMQQASTLIEHLIGIAMMGSASTLEVQILATGKLTGQQCKDYRQVISETAGWDTLGRPIQEGEQRYQFDIIQRIEGGYGEKFGLQNFEGTLSLLSGLRRATDWKRAAEVSDEFMGKVVEIAKIENDQLRLQELNRLEEELGEMQRDASSIAGRLKLVAGAGARGEIAGQNCIFMMAPAAQMVEQAAVRTRQLSDFLDLAFALEQFRITNNEFPSELSLLSPVQIQKLPIDRFNGKPIRYERMTERTGYRLTSVYRDQKYDPNIAPLEKAETESDTSDDTVFTVVIETPPSNTKNNE